VNVDFALMAERHPMPTHAPAFHEWFNDDGSIYLSFFRQPQGYLLRFPQMADFDVARDGKTVRAWPAAGLSSGTLEHLWLNQVLPLALTLQGRLVLHGSAVSIDGRGVAFLGNSGMGKSTLAASFAVCGTHFLTDDGLLLGEDGGWPTVVPSHPSVRLWQDSEEALLPPGSARAPAVCFTDKARLLAGPSIAFRPEPAPLGCVYFLDDQEVGEVTITPMKPAEVMISCVKNSFLLDIDEQEQLSNHFNELARLAELPIHFRLDYPRQYEHLPTVRQAIVSHTQNQFMIHQDDSSRSPL
jgi:hypothetical protein